MPRDIAPDIYTEINKTSQTAPFIWLLEVRQDDDTAIRVCRYTTQITWGGDVYYPFPFTIDRVSESTDGANQVATVSVIDPRGDLTETLNATNGLTDAVVMVRLVHSENLDETDVLEFRYKVSACTRSAQDKTITWTLGEMSVFGWDAPYQLYRRAVCIWAFGGAECLYDTNTPGAYTTCDKTWPACVARGVREAAAGLERKHPRRWGGCKDIPLPRQ